MNNKVFKKGYIYHICNMIDDMIYVGKTIDIDKRWEAHLYHAKTKYITCGATKYMIKIGYQYFYFYIVCEVDYIDDADFGKIEATEINKFSKDKSLNRARLLYQLNTGFKDDYKVKYYHIDK